MNRPPLIILAGGKGTRLREIIGPDIPKPMVDIEGKPFLYWLIKHYRNQGFTDITISTGYKAEVIENYSWPKEWDLKFLRDGPGFNGWDKLRCCKLLNSIWVCNGDTFIPETLPDITKSTSTILVNNYLDAGAQYHGAGKIKLVPCFLFFDIGTPESLLEFKFYFDIFLKGRL